LVRILNNPNPTIENLTLANALKRAVGGDGRYI
jgi:hypothetical protein